MSDAVQHAPDTPDGPAQAEDPGSPPPVPSPVTHPSEGAEKIGSFSSLAPLPRSTSNMTASSSSTTESGGDLAGPTHGHDQADAKAYNLPGYHDHLWGRELVQSFSTLTQRDDASYDLTTGKKPVIVFNHVSYDGGDLPKRNGTESDCQAILSTFHKTDFDVRIYDDLKFSQIEAVLRNLQQEANLSCLILFILTHGEENGILHAADKPFRLEKHVIQELLPSVCPSLNGKPKLIFVQACQGKETDPGTEIHIRSRHSSTDGPVIGYRIPHYADFLVFQAAYHGHYSFRSRSGSWFVQALCLFIKEADDDEDLMSVLTKVKRYVSLNKASNMPSNPDLDRKKQIPLVQDTLLRKVYLFQKIAKVENGGEDERRGSFRNGRGFRRDLMQETSASAPASPARSRRLRQDGREVRRRSEQRCSCM